MHMCVRCNCDCILMICIAVLSGGVMGVVVAMSWKTTLTLRSLWKHLSVWYYTHDNDVFVTCKLSRATQTQVRRSSETPHPMNVSLLVFTCVQTQVVQLRASFFRPLLFLIRSYTLLYLPPVLCVSCPLLACIEHLMSSYWIGRFMLAAIPSPALRHAG